MPEWDPKKVEKLISELESEDSFARLGAIEGLEQLTRQTFGFRFNGPPEERQAAVDRWKAWWKEQKREKERRQQLQAAVQLSGGVLDVDTLKKAIKEIPAEKIQGYLNALILKMKAQEFRCESCGAHPATVSVTEIAGGKVRTRRFCDRCAAERGDALG
jgi:hypothetical protein